MPRNRLVDLEVTAIGVALLRMTVAAVIRLYDGTNLENVRKAKRLSALASDRIVMTPSKREPCFV